MSFANPLLTHGIVIEMDPEEKTYNIDFKYCSVRDAYLVLKDIVAKMETGELFEGADIYDTDGNKLDPRAAVTAVTGEFREDDSEDN